MKAHTQAGKRYIRRFIPMMIAYVAILFGSITAIDVWEPVGLELVILSVLPALPIIGVLIVIGAYLIEERDEYLKQRIVTAMMFGTGILLSVATVLGFLQIGEVLGRVDVFWAFPLWCAAWGAAQCWMSLRERIAGAGE